ncbi:MAG: TatD family hydrolase [Pirellulales bacterium]
MPLFDAHAHLDQEEFDEDREAVIARAREAGVEEILAVGVSADSSEATVRLAQAHPGVYAAVGLHPNYCGQAVEGDWDRVAALARRGLAVALGETGLDRYREHTPFAVQQDYFERHLRLAQECDLPFICHCRQSEPDVMALLREARARGPISGVMHAFVGDAATARECLELGLYLSFAGMATFKKNDAIRAVAAAVPAERILVETDCPYLAPHPLRGKRNEPALLVYTAACLAEVRGQSLDQFAAQTVANARKLFGRRIAATP